MELKLVLHFVDGRVVKGTTVNFNPVAPSFNLSEAEAPPGAEPMVVWLKDLKAVFFVKTFAGSSDYKERKEFAKNDTFQGRRLRVVFNDDEVMVGSSPNYSPGCPGFFFFPVDPKANMLKAWIPGPSIRTATFLP